MDVAKAGVFGVLLVTAGLVSVLYGPEDLQKLIPPVKNIQDYNIFKDLGNKAGEAFRKTSDVEIPGDQSLNDQKNSSPFNTDTTEGDQQSANQNQNQENQSNDKDSKSPTVDVPGSFDNIPKPPKVNIPEDVVSRHDNYFDRLRGNIHLFYTHPDYSYLFKFTELILSLALLIGIFVFWFNKHNSTPEIVTYKEEYEALKVTNEQQAIEQGKLIEKVDELNKAIVTVTEQLTRANKVIDRSREQTENLSKRNEELAEQNKGLKELSIPSLNLQLQKLEENSKTEKQQLLEEVKSLRADLDKESQRRIQAESEVAKLAKSGNPETNGNALPHVTDPKSEIPDQVAT